jgi:hypothetical protein
VKTWTCPSDGTGGEVRATVDRVLVVEFPEVPGTAHSPWRDAAEFGLATLERDGSRARRTVRALFGGPVSEDIVAAVRAAARSGGGDADADTRTWSRTIGRGFCSGDLDDCDELAVSDDGVRGESWTHSYGRRSREEAWRLSFAAFLAPSCARRSVFADCLPRIDEEVRQRMALPGTGGDGA